MPRPSWRPGATELSWRAAPGSWRRSLFCGRPSAAPLARLPEVAPPGPAGRLLTLMAEKERLPLLPQVVQSARRLALEREGGALGTVTCARPLTEDQLSRLKETLCRLHRLKKVELEVRVDPALLGGLRLELQGVTYDKSVRGGLDALARTLGEGRAL